MGFGFQKSESKAKDIQAAEFQALRDSVAGELGAGIGGAGGLISDPNAFNPRRAARRYSANIRPQEIGSLMRLNQQATQPGLLETGIEGSLLSELSGQFLNLESNPYFQQNIEAMSRPIRQVADEQRARDRSDFAQAGQARFAESSPFHATMQKRDQAELNAIKDLTAQSGNEQFTQALNRRMQASQQGLSQLGFRFNRELENLQAQGLPRLIEQRGLELGLQEFMDRRQQLMQLLAVSAQTSGVVPGQFSESMGGNVGI